MKSRPLVVKVSIEHQDDHQDDHQHDYAIALVDMELAAAYELNRFQAPCAVVDDRANMATIIAALRDTADQLADAHADLLGVEQCSAHSDGLNCLMREGHTGDHSDGVTRWPGDPIAAATLVDLLSLACVSVTVDQVSAWTPEQREQAEKWAAATHLSASDNNVEVPAWPEFLIEADAATREEG